MRDVLAAGVAVATPTALTHAGDIAGARALQQSTLVVNGLDPSVMRPKYLDMLQAGGVNCWYPSAGNLKGTLEFCEKNKDRAGHARTVREIRDLYGRGKMSLISGWQDAGALVDKASSVEQNLQRTYDLGLRICGIAYNVTNEFGGGSLEPDEGLTDAGRRLVEGIHKRRILLDVAGHTGERTSFDALAMSSGVPVICSHTNIRALNDNPRCTTDKLLEAIAKTGGVIGVTAFNDFHARTRHDANVLRTPQVGLERHLDQYDYLKKLVGVDHIGLGPDFVEARNGSGPVPPEAGKSISPEAYSQVMPFLYVKDFENISQLPNVTDGLRNRGWSDAEIRKVLGENWLRVYQQVWGA
jgi:membrane dipeptidase